MMTWLWPGLFLATVPAANWMIGNVGTCVPSGPCLLPVAPGLMAPSGVYVIGAAFMLRDLVHRDHGMIGVAVCIMIGAVISALVAAPGLALASVAAFVISETLDTAIFARLRERGFLIAAATSSVVGAVIDSAAFLLIAFGSLDYVAGQIVGKLWAVAAFALAIRARGTE